MTTQNATPTPVETAPDLDFPYRTDLPLSYEDQTRAYVDNEGVRVDAVLETARLRLAVSRKFGPLALNNLLLPVMIAPDGMVRRKQLPTNLREAQQQCIEHDVAYWLVSDDHARAQIERDALAIHQAARHRAVIYIDANLFRSNSTGGVDRYTYVGHTHPDHYDPDPFSFGDQDEIIRDDAYEAASFFGLSSDVDVELAAFVIDLARETGLRRVVFRGAAARRHPLTHDILSRLLEIAR